MYDVNNLTLGAYLVVLVSYDPSSIHHLLYLWCVRNTAYMNMIIDWYFNIFMSCTWVDGQLVDLNLGERDPLGPARAGAKCQ